MDSFTINIDFKDIGWLRTMTQMYPECKTPAMNRAIDRTKTFSVDKVMEAYNIPKRSDVNKAVKAWHTSARAETVKLNFRGQRFDIGTFLVAHVNQKGLPIKMRLAPMVEIKRGLIKAAGIGKKGYSKPFFAQMKSGHKGIFQRIGQSILPIKEMKTLSVPEMVASLKIRDAVSKFFWDAFAVEFDRQLDRFYGMRKVA
jgi:hypothetical protein